VLDLETGLFSATNPIGLQPEVIRQWAETWIAEVQSAMGRQVKLYGYPSYLAALAVPTGSLLAQCELIIAHYGPRKPTIPAPWKRAIAWQYLADPSPPTNTPAGQIDGYDPPKGFGVDCDVFLGTEDELRSWWARSAIADERVPDTLPEGIALDTPGPHTKPHEMPTTSQLINAAFGRGSAT
jgi:GH25 family lysozyme M1 (1,4-beta-N-acetylmuramidase)